MKILLVSHFYSTHGGGVETVALEVARQLSERHGCSITWIASDCDPPVSAPGLQSLPMRCFNSLERVLGIPYPLWSMRSIGRMVRSIAAADVVHLHECLYMGNILAFFAARLHGKPVLVTQHIGAVPFKSAILRCIHEVMNRLLGRLILGGANQTVFISRSVQDYFEPRIRFNRRPQHIPNGVDAALFRPPRSPEEINGLRRELNLPPEHPVLLFVGRFVEKKGLHLLKQMVQRTPQWVWAFAGHGVQDPGKWGLPNVVVYRGRRQATLVPLYHAADLLVLPSVGEGFPLVVQESLACGTPAVVSDDIPQALPEAASMLFSAMSPANQPRERVVAAWLSKLESLLQDRKALREGASARAGRARELWSWTRCGEAYAHILDKLADRSCDALHCGDHSAQGAFPEPPGSVQTDPVE
jgi:glycosyltransferase involved in cell wall biosynthesis